VFVAAVVVFQEFVKMRAMLRIDDSVTVFGEQTPATVAAVARTH
jgi:hypothetical protein